MTGRRPRERSERDEEDHGDLSVADWATMKTRLLAGQCSTCVFRPGNLMHLNPGRLRDLVEQARRAEGFVVCHQTLPGTASSGVRPAICRGFADRYDTGALQVIRRLWGFIEVPPPRSRRAGSRLGEEQE